MALARTWRRLPALAAVATVQLLVAALVLGARGIPGAFGGDFIAYYAAGQHVLQHGWGGLYDLAAQRATEAPLLARSGLAPSAPSVIPFNYPAPAALLLLPLALLPPAPAMALWSLLNGGVALLTTRWLATRAAVPGRGVFPALTPFLFLPLDWGLLAGQPAGVTFALGAVSFICWRDGRERSLGVALAMLAIIKPQLAVAPALGLLALGRRRALVALIASGAALLALALALVGVDGLRAYLRLLATMDPAQGNAALAVRATAMVNWRALLARVPDLAPADLLAATIVAAIATLVATAVACCRWREQPIRAYLIITVGGLLASYHSHYQDLVLLLPPLVAIAQGRFTVTATPRLRLLPPRSDSCAVDSVAQLGSPRPASDPLGLRYVNQIAPATVAPGAPNRRVPLQRLAACAALAILVVGPGLTWLALGVFALAWLPAFTTLAIPGLLLLALAAALPDRPTSSRVVARPPAARQDSA